MKKLSETQEHVFQPSISPKAINLFRNTLIGILLSSILALGITSRIDNLNNVAERSPDENTYTYFAKTIVQNGVSEGIKMLTKEHVSNKETWIYFPPPPTRVGYFWLISGAMRITNSTDIKIGAYVSCAFSIISLLLLIVIGLRLFNTWITLFALLLMSVSPVELAIARRTWQDAIVECVGLLLIYLSCEICRNTKRIIWYPLLIVTGSCFLSLKESAVLIYGLCIIWLLWILLFKEQSILKGLFLIIASSLGVGITIAILVHISGGISAIAESLKCWIKAMPTNQYAIEYQSGPWYNFLQGFWIVSPVSTILCLIGIAGTLSSKENLRREDFLCNPTNRRAIIGITLFMITFLIIAMSTPLFQNFRYISILFVPFYLISGLGLWYVISIVKSSLKSLSFYLIILIIAIALILTAMRDYSAFIKIFIRTGAKDVSIKMLKDYSR